MKVEKVVKVILCSAKDSQGRDAYAMASDKNRALIRERLHFCGRFDTESDTVHTFLV